jgi:uncharacterized protein YgbK (DUF1537 family)
MAGELDAGQVESFLTANSDRAPLAYSSDEPAKVAALQERYGREEIAARLGVFFADIARGIVAAGTRRLVVAGGETSGAIVSALGIDALGIGPEIAPGVPVLTASPALALALKSGNFGQEDFFDRALAMMAGDSRRNFP